jgi:hypothetical protein
MRPGVASSRSIHERDPDFYEATEVAYDLEGAQATERSSQTTRILT